MSDDNLRLSPVGDLRGQASAAHDAYCRAWGETITVFDARLALARARDICSKCKPCEWCFDHESSLPAPDLMSAYAQYCEAVRVLGEGILRERSEVN